MTTAIATRTESQQLAQQSPTGELTVQDLIDRKRKILDVMKAVMIEGEHYGKIPGCGDKPTLLKAGAEVLATTFGLTPRFKIEQTDFPGGHREIRITCQLVSIGTDRVIGEGVGSCSTMESKYRWRGGARICPECGKSAIIKGKEEYGGGWLCFGKKGGCGAKWKDGDPAIEGQSIDRVENPDVADQYNTILKMAKKRAQVDATLTATGASDLLTQDIEDLPPASRGYDKPRREHIEDAEYIDNISGDGEAGDPPRGSPTAHERPLSDLEKKAVAIVEDIKAAKSVKAVKDLASRFADLPKGTEERAFAYDAYAKRIADIEHGEQMAAAARNASTSA